jgi:transcription antitermination factor NusA-like protein
MAMLNAADFPQTEPDEVLALGRMVSFVCQRAKQLNLEMSTYFLEMALTSLVQDIGEIEAPSSISGEHPLPSSANELH